MSYLAAFKSRRVLEVSAVKTAMCKSLFLDADRGHFNEWSLIEEKRPVSPSLHTLLAFKLVMHLNYILFWT